MKSPYVLFCIVAVFCAHFYNTAIVIISMWTRKRQDIFFNNFDLICFLLSRCPLLAWRKSTRHHGSVSTATQTAATRASPLRANKPAKTSNREVRKRAHLCNAVTWELSKTISVSLCFMIKITIPQCLIVDSFYFPQFYCTSDERARKFLTPSC